MQFVQSPAEISQDSLWDDGDKKFFIPMIAHKMKNYDSHLIIKSLTSRFVNLTGQPVTCIASNTEKFISFQIGCMRFLDSYQFLNCSLETLVANIAVEGTDKFIHTKRHILDPTKFALMTRKCIYPYEFMTDVEKFNCTELPQQADFFS